MRYSEIDHQHFPFKDPKLAYGVAIDLLPKDLADALKAGDQLDSDALLEAEGDPEAIDETAVLGELTEQVPGFAKAEIRTNIIANRLMKSGIDGPILYKCEFPEIKLSS